MKAAIPILALAVAACVPAADPAEREAELASLIAAAERYHAAASAKDREGVVAMYDADALMVPPSADLVEREAGVAGYRFGFIETPGVSLDFTLVRAEVAASGDIGWTLGVGEITIERADGPPGRDRVRDFHTWKRQDDGSWKIVVDIWNSAAPAS